MSAGTTSLYERAGGLPWFEALAARFYDAVAHDAVLAPLYPPDPEGLAAAKDHLCGFLVQYWGGPDDYSRARGHPRLRMRHARFSIGSPERAAWLRHMTDAVVAGGLDREDEAEMLGYFAMAATHLVNRE